MVRMHLISVALANRLLHGIDCSTYLKATNIESPMAIYVDNVYIRQMSVEGFSLFDEARVETLDGPQGTLFDRNAIGGLVHFLTLKPGFEFDADYKIQASQIFYDALLAFRIVPIRFMRLISRLIN